MEIEVIIDMHIEQCNVVVIIKYEIKSMKTLKQGWIYTIFHRLPEDGLKNRRKKQKRMRARTYGKNKMHAQTALTTRAQSTIVIRAKSLY